MRSTRGNALLISPWRDDHVFLQALFLKNGWGLRGATSLGSAQTLAQTVPIVLTEADIPPGTWKDVLALTGALPNPPLVIVVSIHADEHLWVEALNLGAHDVIAKPFDVLEVTRVLGAAWGKCEPPAVKRKRMGASN